MIPGKRPKIITVLAISLLAAAIGGIVLTILFSLFFDVGSPRYLVAFVGLGYAASALASAVGLWRMMSWSVGTVAVWGVFAVLLSLPMTATAWSAGARALVMAGAALGAAGLAIYVSRQLRRAAPHAG